MLLLVLGGGDGGLNSPLKWSIVEGRKSWIKVCDGVFLWIYVWIHIVVTWSYDVYLVCDEIGRCWNCLVELCDFFSLFISFAMNGCEYQLSW